MFRRRFHNAGTTGAFPNDRRRGGDLIRENDALLDKTIYEATHAPHAMHLFFWGVNFFIFDPSEKTQRGWGSNVTQDHLRLWGGGAKATFHCALVYPSSSFAPRPASDLLKCITTVSSCQPTRSPDCPQGGLCRARDPGHPRPRRLGHRQRDQPPPLPFSRSGCFRFSRRKKAFVFFMKSSGPFPVHTPTLGREA